MNQDTMQLKELEAEVKKEIDFIVHTTRYRQSIKRIPQFIVLEIIYVD